MLLGIIFVSILGTIFHFVYDWSGQNFFVGFFTAINESTWEHMKLLFFPMFLYCLLTSGFLTKKEEESNPCADALGILSGTFLIPVLFYTYSGILGFNIPVIDIATFFISVIFAFWLRKHLYEYQKCSQKSGTILSLAVIILFFCFLIFTYQPPKLGIFEDPVSQKIMTSL